MHNNTFFRFLTDLFMQFHENSIKLFIFYEYHIAKSTNSYILLKINIHNCKLNCKLLDFCL